VRLAAVLGREFDFDLLNAIWGRGEEATLEALDDLLRHRLIDEDTGPLGRDYTFTHHKIQEVVYAGMPRRRQQHAHARAGAAMETLYGPEVKALASELAFHFEQGRQLDKTLTEKAIHYLLQAGDWARGLYAHGDAIDYYQRGAGTFEGKGGIRASGADADEAGADPSHRLRLPTGAPGLRGRLRPVAAGGGS
jgi:predicted ATPase